MSKPRYRIQTLGAAGSSTVALLQAAQACRDATADGDTAGVRRWCAERDRLRVLADAERVAKETRRDTAAKAARVVAALEIAPGDRLIRNVKNWPDFQFTETEAGAFERRDHRAIVAAAQKRAEKTPPVCPVPFYKVEENDPDPDTGAARWSVIVQLRRPNGKLGEEVGHLSVTDKGKTFQVDGAFIDDPDLLASCRGIGTRMYERAAREACTRGGKVLSSSNLRSAFSERFWTKQLRKERAVCSANRAVVYDRPHKDLVADLRSGHVTVPQFNQLVANLPAYPGISWPCETIALKPCPAPASLEGLKRRRRSR